MNKIERYGIYTKNGNWYCVERRGGFWFIVVKGVEHQISSITTSNQMRLPMPERGDILGKDIPNINAYQGKFVWFTLKGQDLVKGSHTSMIDSWIEFS
ncbi:hypothetical protein CL616_02090 [archaeon]|nr:hypothetical protein [archaeon]